jgi:hypothetical protein
MADDPAPVWFRDIAKSAGGNVKAVLQGGLPPVSKNPAHASYDLSSFNTERSDDQSSILKDVKEKFEIQVGLPNAVHKLYQAESSL